MEFGREMSRLSRPIYREFCLFFLVLLVIYCTFLPFMFCQFSLLEKKIPYCFPFVLFPAILLRLFSSPLLSSPLFSSLLFSSLLLSSPLFSSLLFSSLLLPSRFCLRGSCSKNLFRISTRALFKLAGTFRNISQVATGICSKTHQRGP